MEKMSILQRKEELAGLLKFNLNKDTQTYSFLFCPNGCCAALAEAIAAAMTMLRMVVVVVYGDEL